MESGTHFTIGHSYTPYLSLLENSDVNIASSKERHLEINGLVDADGVIRFKKRKISASRTFPRGCGRFSQSAHYEALGFPLAKAAIEIVLMPKCLTNCVSAKRRFPFGCGRNSRKLTLEERKKFLSSRSNGVNVVKRTDPINSVREISDPGRMSFKKSKMEERIASANAQTEQRKTIPFELTRKKFSIPMLSNDSEIANTQEDKEHERKCFDMDFFRDKVIVQALMAAPNCPWMQGKRTPKSFSKGKLNVKKEGTASRSKSLLVVEENLGTSLDALAVEKSSLAVKIEDEPAFNDVNNIYPTVDDDEVLKSVEPISVKPLNFSVSLIPFGLSSSRNEDQVGTRKKVRETLRLFQAIVRKLLQEEERKPKGQMQSLKRVDLIACKLLKEKNRWVNTGKPIMGNVPGVEVGDEFQYRVELCMIGLHRAIQGGIDYLKQGNTILATSIVASGGYHDDFDSTDVLIYSGQGGGLVGDKKHPEDQKLERGNLALKNAIDAKTSVRVIRGFKEMKILDTHEGTRPKVTVTYTYDGFYQVEEYWKEKGPHGHSVFKFRLRRLPGQVELPWKIVKQAKGSNKNIMRRGLCIGDISDNKEKIPIGVVNTLDNDRPMPFTYIATMMYPDWHHPTLPRGCDCTDGCSNSGKCACAVKNGGEIPFNYNGAIVEAKPLIYECGPSCKCLVSCHNRVSQHGIRFPLEVFKTESRGWGVRSLTSIPSGSFICEYVGELLRDTEADERTGNDEYLFDIGHNYNDQSLWEGLSNFIPDLQRSACEEVDDVGYTIDALNYGNVGRFINHSCSPNLYAQNVLYEHDDKTLPHIMLFAAENIPPLQELTYHYNYTLDQVRDSEGNIKRKECYCGSNECTGRLY